MCAPAWQYYESELAATREAWVYTKARWMRGIPDDIRGMVEWIEDITGDPINETV